MINFFSSLKILYIFFMQSYLSTITTELPLSDFSIIKALLLESRGGSRAAVTSKMECFVIRVNGFCHIISSIR